VSPRNLDVVITGGGTVYLFHLLTAVAREWFAEHVSGERQLLGDALAVEHRYVVDVAAGMAGDGLLVRLGAGVR
jgi:hypothetical protein